MRVTSAFISSFLFASAVLADGSDEPQFLDLVKRSLNTEYMAGAIYNMDPGTFNSIGATIRVPEHRLTPAGTYAIAWIGIDGSACNFNTTFRAGVIMAVDDDNNPSFTAFAQRYPGHFETFPDIIIYPGHVLQFWLTSPTLTSGEVYITDPYDDGWVKQMEFDSFLALCGQSVQWAITPVSRDGGQTYLPLTDFRNVTFERAVASGPERTLRPEQGAEAVNIVQYNEVRTWIAFGNAAVTVYYVP